MMSEYSEVQSGEIPFGNFSGIAERSVEDELQEKLKPAAFGGYSKGSVNQYTKELKSSLEQMRTNLEQQIKELVAEKGNLSQECSLLRSQLSEAEKRVAQLQKESQEQEDKVSQIVEKMNLKIQNMDHENETLRLESSKVKEAKNELEQLRQQLQAKENEVGNLTAQLEESQYLCEELKSRIQELENIPKIPSVDASELEELKKENESLSSRLQDAEQCIKTLREKWSKENEAFSEKLRAAEQRNQQLQQSLSELENNRSDRSLQLKKDYLDELDTAYHALREAKEDKSLLLNQTEKQSKANAALTEKFNLLQDQLISARNQSASLKDEKAVLEEQIAKYRSEEQKQELLKEQNESLSKGIASMEDGVKDILSQMELQKTMILEIISRSTESFTVVQEKLNSLIQEKANLQDRNVSLMEEIRKLTANLSSVELEKAQLRKRLNLQVTADSAERTALSTAGFEGGRATKSPKAVGEVFEFDEGNDGVEETAECPSIDMVRNRALDITQWLARNSDEIKNRYATMQRNGSEAKDKEG